MLAASLNCIIFSKDRALQLCSLIESVRDHITDVPIAVTVLYTTSSGQFAAGYDRLKAMHLLPNVKWVAETDFRQDLISAVDDMNPAGAVMLLVDDDVIYRPCTLAPLLGSFMKRHLFISLRVDRSYRRHRLPKFLRTGPFLEWRWHDVGRATGWQYPFSVDGNIFHTGDLAKLIKRVSFKAPNSLEGVMHSKRHGPAFSLCRPKALAVTMAVLFNNPLNKVQDEGETWNEGLSVEDLNARWCAGARIDNRKLYSAVPDETHFAVALELLG